MIAVQKNFETTLVKFSVRWQTLRFEFDEIDFRERKSTGFCLSIGSPVNVKPDCAHLEKNVFPRACQNLLVE